MWILLERLKEPSTYAGLSGLMIAIGLSTEQWSVISTAIAGVAGIVAMVLKDRKQLKFKLSVYNHTTESYIASKLIEASSISSAAKLAEIHFKELLKENKDVTLKVEELKNDIENNS